MNTLQCVHVCVCVCVGGVTGNDVKDKYIYIHIFSCMYAFDIAKLPLVL